MAFVSEAFNLFYQFMDSFAFLILASAGLAIIFGMMGVINMAHGEFIMLGAYITTLLVTRLHLPLPLAILLGAVGVGVYGLVIERLIVHRLYGRPLDTVVATWGIGLIMSQGILILLGPSLPGLSTPLGSFSLHGSSYSVYRMLLGASAIALLALLYWLFTFTRFGLRARATMQNPEIASALGVNTSWMYSLTFMLGASLAGLTGGLFAPTTTIVPNFGTSFTVESFVTVIVGGASPLVGTSLSGVALGIISSGLAKFYTTFVARVGLLIATIIVIRVLPKGLSGLISQKGLRGV